MFGYAGTVKTEIAPDARRMKALGHPVRLGIAVQLAATPETCACDFADVFGVSQPTVSEHLKILSQAGLLSAKRVKQWTFYKRDEARIAKLKAAMLEKI